MNVYWFCLFFWNFNFTVNLWPCHPPLTFENLVTDISLTPNDLWGFIIRLFKEFLKKNFFDQNPYIGFLRRFFFSDWKLESIERFFGQFTNGDEFIIFRVFAAKIFFCHFCQKNCFFEKLKNKLYIITFEVFLWQKIFFENDHVMWKWHFSSLTASIAFKRISIALDQIWVDQVDSILLWPSTFFLTESRKF